MPIQMKILSALAKVFLDEAPRHDPGEPALSGFQNEVLSFQLAYRDEGVPTPWTYRRFVSVALDSPIAPIIRVRRVGHVPVRVATFPSADDNYLRKTPGVYPDMLVDVDKTRLRLWSDQWQSVWFDVEPTADTAPGVYPITIRLMDAAGDDGALGEVVTQVEILPGMLPAQTLRYAKWVHCDAIAQYYHEPMWSERFWDILERTVALAGRRGINMLLTPIHTPPLDTAEGGERLTCQLVDVALTNGSYTFGFDRLRRYVAMAQRCGMKYFDMAHLFTQWGAKATPKIIATVDGAQKRIFGWDVPAQSDAYRAYLAAFLPALTAELRALGIAGETYFHISDEPQEAHFDSYVAAKAMVAPYLEGFEIIDALSSVEFYKRGALTKPIPANNHIHPFIDAGVQGLWSYYCIAQFKDVSNIFIAQPSARNRIYGLQLYKYNIEGILQWALNFYNSMYSEYPINPFATTDGDGFAPAGDMFTVYPGEDGEPIESLRMVVTAQAIYDLRACLWLESLTSKAFVMDILEGGLDEEITFHSYPQTDAYLLGVRARINREIVQRL